MKIKNGFLEKVTEKDIKYGRLIIPDKVKAISSNACKGLKSLKYVQIPDSVVMIGKSAFEDSGLLEIKLPKYLQLEKRAFARSGLIKIETERVGEIPEGCFQGCSKLTDVSLNEGVRYIGASAFSDCRSLKKIELPNSVEIIDDCAFGSCYDLEDVVLGDAIQTIGDNAFSSCWHLNIFYMPENVRYIGQGAFINTLVKCTIPKYCTFIGKDAFARGGNRGPWETNKRNIVKFNEDGTATISMEYGGDDWKDPISPQAIPVVNKHPHFKEQLLKDMKDPKIARLYAWLNFWLTKEQFENFYENKNLKFFKQIQSQMYYDNDDIFTLLYNLGALNKPVEKTHTTKSGKQVTKKIDYAQKICGLFVDDERIIKLFGQWLKEHEEWHFAEMGFAGFNQEFTEFFLDKTNLTELLEEEKQHPGFIARCFIEFEQFQKQNTSNKGSQRQLKPTVAKMKAYFARERLAEEPEEQRDIVLEVERHLTAKEYIKRALKIDTERKRKKTPDHLVKDGVKQSDIMAHIDEMRDEIKGLSVATLQQLKNLADNEFTFEFLSKSDPANFILGKLCNCCAHLAGAGYGIMHASIVSPDVQNLVIRDAFGQIVAKSTLYVNRRRGYGVFNNVEVAEKYVKETWKDSEKLEKIFETYRAAIATFAEKYNAEHSKKPIKIITVGMKNNDLIDEIVDNQRRATGSEKKKAISYKRFGRHDKRYNGDSASVQRIMWEMGVEDEREIY